MSNCIETAVVPHQQLCYIPCNFCNIILAVSVPCSNLFDIVTVRCGHCTNLWSVNMATAFQTQDVQTENYKDAASSSPKANNKIATRPPPTNFKDQMVVNRPPEKRQRIPSAYNQFIKEEIRRIKANNPDVSHREAFSTAAKNWAHFPHTHFGLMMETNSQTKLDNGHEKHLMPRATVLLNK